MIKFVVQGRTQNNLLSLTFVACCLASSSHSGVIELISRIESAATYQHPHLPAFGRNVTAASTLIHARDFRLAPIGRLANVDV
jgi:hypothetical protein